MKRKIFFVMVAVIAAVSMLMLTSCSKENRIEGRWVIRRVSDNLMGTGTEGHTWTFRDNRTCLIYLDGEDLEGNWSISGDNLTIGVNYYYNGEDYKFTGDFTITNLGRKELSLTGKWILASTGNGSDDVSYRFDR